MGDCSKHKKEINGITDMRTLAEMIGNLHYETLADLLEHLSDKLWKDGQKDFERDRVKLSDNLIDASFEIKRAHFFIWEAWVISKPFMDK